MKLLSFCLICMLISSIPLTGNMNSVYAAGKERKQKRGSQEGLATFYSSTLNGGKTASGEPHNKNRLVAAHSTLPLGTNVRVTNLKNKRAVIVQINDRVPKSRPRNRGIVIDLSRAAAEQLGFIKEGKARVRVEEINSGGD